MSSEKISWSEAIEISQEIARKAEAERGEEGTEEGKTMSEEEFDLDNFHLKIVYAGEFPDPHYTNDLIEAAEEALATIETLRRRVAELEEERDTANAHLDEVLDRSNRVLGERESLTAENAELKDRQKTLIEVFIHDPRQWDTEEAGGTATVLACLLLEKVREFIAQHGHDPKGNVEDAFTAITAENAELKRQVEALREAVTAILEGEMPDYKSQEEFGGYVLDDSIREKAKSALREAAKTGE